MNRLSSKYDDPFVYDDYDYDDRSRSSHRQSGNRKRKKEKQKRTAVVAQLADAQDSVTDWVPSYCANLDPKHHERTWVIKSIGPFYRDEIVTDVTRIVKGGKEANVYTCAAHPATGLEHIAAKLYRPRMLRHLKNDAIYKAGRTLRDANGKQIKGRREKLALRKKTRFGKKVDIDWWIGNEFRSQQKLYEAGADVPQPIGHIGNTILMAHVGDDSGAAPTLSETGITTEEAQLLFERIMDNVALMLDNHLIHGDLSAYNILYWEGEITIIDFPQMIEARHNPHAFELLERDIQRVYDYFARFGVEADSHELTVGLWQPYMGRDH
ncbi:MAG: RIO1 family regulatory kinase/ATPase [Chloroflexota bacterium]